MAKRSKSIKNEAEYNLDLVRKHDEKEYDEVFEINTKIYLGEENIKAAETFFFYLQYSWRDFGGKSFYRGSS